MIYLDNAATTMTKPPEVIEAVCEAMRTFGNAARGAHEGALATARTVYDTRRALAEFFGCERADHVVFTSNSTEALNVAISGLFGPGDHVLTTALEHNSVLRPLYRLQRERGVELSVVPADRRGNIDYEDFERMLRPNTRGIVCTHASNLTGTVLDAARIGAFAETHGLLFVLDASQTAGSIPVSMRDTRASALCFTGHKSMMGPQGTGGLCVRPGVEIRPFKVGGTGVKSYLRTQPEEWPTRLEAGTLNGHGIAGLGAAVRFLTRTGLGAIGERERMLTDRFLAGISGTEGVTVYGDVSAKPRCPIVALNVRAYDSAIVADALATDYRIAVRAGAHCAPLMHEALGTEGQGAVRFSFNWYNTEEEADAAANAVRELARA